MTRSRTSPHPGMVTIRPADSIWHQPGGWFDARWHFSFDRYRDPEQLGVGALRVFNDDRTSPAPSGRFIPTRTSSRSHTSSRASSSTRTRSGTTVASRPALRRS